MAQSDDRSAKLIGAALLVGGMAVFGSATPVSKMVGEDLPVFTASLMRVALGAAVLAPFALRDWRRADLRLERRDWFWLSMIALFGMAGFTLFLISGMKFISGVAGGVIMSFTPALTALGASLFLGAALGWRKISALALGLVGLLVINLFRGRFGGGEAGGLFFLGVALVLAAIACEGCYTLIGKKATERMPPILASFLACALSLPLFVVLAAFDIGQLDAASVPLSAWAALGWWGVGTLGLGSALWYSGVARADGATAAGFMAVMPLTAIVLSYVLLGEDFHLIHLPGIAAVLASVGMMSWVHMRMARSQKGEAEDSEAG